MQHYFMMFGVGRIMPAEEVEQTFCAVLLQITVKIIGKTEITSNANIIGRKFKGQTGWNSI